MNKTDLGYLLALVRFPKFGGARIGKLRNFFPSMKDAFNASREDLLRASIKPSVVEAFLIEREHLNPKKELALLDEHEVTAIDFDDPSYPTLLKEIYDPPAVLLVRGELPDDTLPHLAVVGSRKFTDYGRRSVEHLVTPIADQAVIVSGLAIGIDAFAHEAALRSVGPTIAVLGSGVDRDNIYPSQNRALASRIIAGGGAIISEFPIGTHPLKQHFPFRNRIIAGLCHATLIVEAGEKSGTLITARLSLEHNREVCAVPGPIDSPMSIGANALIKDGAIPVTSAEDLQNILGLAANAVKNSSYVPDSKSEKDLFELLSGDPIHVDELTKKMQLPTQTISTTLTIMEMRGGARHVGGLYYVRG